MNPFVGRAIAAVGTVLLGDLQASGWLGIAAGVAFFLAAILNGWPEKPRV